MKKLKLFVLVYLLSVLTPLATLYTPKGFAASIWTNGVTIAEETLPAGPINGGNIDCDYFTLKSQYLSGYTLNNGQVEYSETTLESPGNTYPDVCMAQNEHGLVGMGFWASDGDITKSMPVDSGPYTMLPASGGDVTLFMTPSPTFGTQYSINHNLPYLGSVGVKPIGAGVSQRNEKVWKIDTSKVDEFLTYSDGQIVRIDQVGLSNNGRYMVAQLSRRGLVLIDLVSKKMTPFSPNAFTTGVNMFINVSNDGRFVAVYSAAGLAVHDVSGCATSYAYGQWPSGGTLQSTGCESGQYFADVRGAYPLVANINRLRFAPNGGSLNIDISWRVNGELVAKRLRLSANGYTKTARGYIAMGDSYSSGEGDTEGGSWYEPGTDEQGDRDTFAGRNLCHLSRRSYPYLMAVELGYLSNNVTTPPADGLFHSVACSGAKIHNIIGSVGEKQDDGNGSDFAVTDNQFRFNEFLGMLTWQPGATAQNNFIKGTSTQQTVKREPYSPEVVTVGIGGNDAGFGDFLLSCVLPGTCEQAQPGSKKSNDVVLRVAQNRKRLVNTYKQVLTAAPEARVYVHGYPKIVEGAGGYCGVNVRFDDQERLFVANIIHYMNEVVKSAAQEAGVMYVDVEDIFDRQKLCSGVEQDQILLNGATAGNDVRPLEGNSFLAAIGVEKGVCIRACLGSESYHPKPGGFVKYKEAILAQTNGLTSSMPTSNPGSVPVPDIYFGSEAINKVIELNAKSGYLPQTLVLQEDLITGFEFSSKTMSVSLSSLAPSSTVEVVVESTPTVVGNFMTSSTGVLSEAFLLPTGLEPGYHELHITARDRTGNKTDFYQSFVIGTSATDFDGDAISDAVDSCVSMVDSGIDVDSDGVDDTCDDQAVEPVLPPAAPGVPDLTSGSDSGAYSDDNITNITQPVLSVDCVADNEVSIYNGETVLGSGVCEAGVAIIRMSQLDDSAYAAITARQADSRGIFSEPSLPLNLTIDTMPSSQPSSPDLDGSSDTGTSNTDNNTDDTTPTLIGACNANEIVSLYVDGVLNASVACSQQSTYVISSAALMLGVRSLTTTATDLAGNESVRSAPLSIVIATDNGEEDDEDDDNYEKCHKFKKDEVKCKQKKLKKKKETPQSVLSCEHRDNVKVKDGRDEKKVTVVAYLPKPNLKLIDPKPQPARKVR